MSQKQKQGFVFGAIILSVSGFLVKLIGAVFRIPLTNMVGSAAMSYYASSYSVYILLLSLSTSGIPTGIAAMISKAIALDRKKDAKTILQIAAKAFIPIGAVLTVLGLIFSKQIATFMNGPDGFWSVFLLMPAILCISVVSVFKGFFQGYNNMAPTAISNVIEAVSKLVFGYGIAAVMHNNGYADHLVVGGAVFGVTVGTFLAMLFMLLRYFFRSKEYRVPVMNLVKEQETPRNVLFKDLMIISLPIMLSSITSNLMGTIDAFVVMNRLTSYLPDEQARLMWGSYSNMSTTIFNLPSFLIIAIGISLVPSISSSFALKKKKAIRNTVNKALKYSSILAFACAFGLYAVSGRVLSLLFPGDPNGVAIATPLLEIISFALISVGLTNITNSILQAVGKSYLSVITVAIGAILKTIITLILLGIPSININGAPIATNISYLIMMVMNIYFMYKHLHIFPNILDVFVKPLIAGAGCFAAAKGFLFVFDKFLSPKIAMFPAILLTCVVYIALIFAMKLITVDEFKQSFLRRKKNS